MKSNVASFLQMAIIFIGIATLAFMLWEPHIEGRNAHATIFEIYFKDPFLAYAYLGSTPFFIALYRTFRLFGYLRQNQIFSRATVNALHAIKYCAIAIIGFIAGGAALIIIFGDKNDRPAGIFMSLLLIFATSLIATVAAISARNIQKHLKTIQKQSESNL